MEEKKHNVPKIPLKSKTETAAIVVETVKDEWARVV